MAVTEVKLHSTRKEEEQVLCLLLFICVHLLIFENLIISFVVKCVSKLT
jgi:hypothetical protein